MKKILLIILLSGFLEIDAQTANTTFNSAFKKFENSPALNHAIIGLYVVNSSTGKPVFSHNVEAGFAPASCQKVVTAATALELLGSDFRYQTSMSYTGSINNGMLDGDIIIKGSGDPTLGSWRYKDTGEESIISVFKNAISRQGINDLEGRVVTDESLWTGEVTPDGWIWQDIGSYYGAGARALNWRENQYDLFLRSGNNIGDTVQIAGTKPSFVAGVNLKSVATAAKKGTGDNAYIYFPISGKYGYVRGTIPVNENKFTISGAMPHPATQLAATLEAAVKKQSVESVVNTREMRDGNEERHLFYSHVSPPLDSIIYWFLKRSVNLYGEALLKTLGYEFTNSGSADSGISVIKNFWKEKGIESSALHIIDGSGLSPGNRITASALVSILEYAKKQSWFLSFYDALPEINGIKMKSGSISGVVSYTGFIRSKTGQDYTFAFMVNNYDGSANEVRRKMWRLLDVLK